MKQVVKVFRTAVLFLLMAVIVMNGVLLVRRLVYKEALPSLFGYSLVTVLSGSMEPEFSPGDMLLIKKQADYRQGDIVTYEHQGSFITHRIMEEDGNSCLTKGDANNAPDGERISKENIFGTLSFVIPGVGNMALFLKSPLGVMVMIVTFVILSELSFWREKRAKEEKEARLEKELEK